MSFESLNLDPQILRALSSVGYTTPTPIQAKSIPVIMEGHDLMASAQTGTGKTAAFILPALNLLATPHPVKDRGPRILVLTPTRELAAQINEAARKYGTFIKAKTTSIVGGMPYPLQNKLLSQPVDILVATPGRLIDHFQRGLFDFKRLDSLGKERLTKLHVEGIYEKYQKDKSWSYQLEDHLVRIQDVENRDVIAQIETKRIDLLAQYAKGKLHGSWSYSEKNWMNEQFLETFRTNELIFSNDRLTGKVRFESLNPSNPFLIAGSLTSEGLMDGAWDFSYQESGIPIREIRRYEKGFLIGLQKNNEVTGEKLDEVVFFNAIQKLDSLDRGFEVDYTLSDRFFGLTFNDGFGQQSKEFRQQYQGTQLLEDALVRLLQFEDEEFVKEDRLLKSREKLQNFRLEHSFEH